MTAVDVALAALYIMPCVIFFFFVKNDMLEKPDKSKEKAEEYAPYIKDDSWHRIRAAINAQTYFEAGANYVLEEIEKVIKSDRILGYPFPSIEMRYNKIISVIEQLKK